MTDRPIEHRMVVQRRFDDVCRIVEAEAEPMLSAATAVASQRAVELVEAAEDTLPGFDRTEPVTIFLIDPERDSEYQAWIDFRWSADPHKRLLANARARLELRPHPTNSTATELILRAHFTPTLGSRHSPPRS